MIELNIDPKGLDEKLIQLAIDRFISEREIRNQQARWDAQRRERTANKRVAVGKRLRVVNAVKRAGLSVKTQDSYYGSSRIGDIGDDGWYRIDLYPSSQRPFTDEAQARWDEGLARLIARLQASDELEFTTGTATDWGREVVVYKVRLKTEN